MKQRPLYCLWTRPSSRTAFPGLQRRIRKGSTWSRRAINIAIAILVLSLAIAVVGALDLLSDSMGGAILAVARIGGLLGLHCQKFAC